ncbi:hypothetical protein ACGC1H_007666 [Rhizoctonia solani]
MDPTMKSELDKIDKEIESISPVLSRALDDDPNLPHLLTSLVSAHLQRYFMSHGLDDIQKAIKYASRALTMTSDDGLGMRNLTSNLGIAYGERFKRLGDIDDLDKGIRYEVLSLSRTPAGDPDLPRQLANLAASHNIRFDRLGELGDIEKAIEYNARAVTLTPKDNPGFSARSERLGTSYLYRFKRLGELNDLEKAIEYQSCGLAMSADDPHLPNTLSNIGSSHIDRFNRLGDLNDLEKAIEYESRALVLTADSHPQFPSRLSNLGLSYRYRFNRLGELNDLGKAIECHSRALALTPNEHPDLSTHLANLGASHMYRFKCSGELADLEKAIEYESRALAFTPDDHTRFPSRLANLGSSHSYRFKRLGDLDDLGKAIDYHSRALVLTSNGHPHLTVYLANLSASHTHRFERLGDLGDLEKAIEYGSRALALTPDDHPDLLSRLTNLGASHTYRFQCTNELKDLEKGIDYGSRALASTPDGHPDLPKHLANLAMSYKHRFPCLGNLDDLKKAIEYESRALAEIGDRHPDSSPWYFNHATSYLAYHIYSENPLHLQESLRLFRISSTSLIGSPRDRFRHAHKWATHASKYPDLNPIEAYQTAIDLLPQFVWLGATTDQRYKDLILVETLPIDAAHAAILSSNHLLALEWLEHTRCIVWNQNLTLRSPLDQLHDSHPTLATHLQTVVKNLQSASSESRGSRTLSSGAMNPEEAGQIHRRLATEYNELLRQIRALPGFEDFLRPMKAEGLLSAARNGPIVVINCHIQRCDAMLILPNKGAVVHLPLSNFSRDKAQSARSKIELSLKRLGLRERGVRIRRELEDKDDFASVLAVLWDSIVKPVIEFLGYTADVPRESLPHITWCPTGPVSFLPLHAAGNYDQPGRGSRIFDYAISSYTPTLAALLATTPSTLNYDSRVLMVGQATTPGLKPLPGTLTELECVKSRLENKVGYSQLTDAQATPSTVLDAMEKHEWVHLACHASQNAYDPTKSGFFLHGDTKGTEATLDLAAINRRSFKKKGLAFLSACQTATGDEALPDEAVHLASGMLMAGYSSVVATMWSVVDEDAPLVADKVYGELMLEGKLGNGEAGRALHNAVAGLREKVGENEFGRWVPYIHIGS